MRAVQTRIESLGTEAQNQYPRCFLAKRIMKHGYFYSCAVAVWVKVSAPFFFFFLLFFFLFFGVTFVHAILYGHILASIFQDGGNPFPVTRLPVLSSVTHSSRHTLLLPTLHIYGSRQVYLRHRRITGFHVVQEATRTHAHKYRLPGASCSFF